MKNKQLTLIPFIIILQILKEVWTYNDTVVFNWTKTPSYCYVEDFLLNDIYRVFKTDIYPIRGCNSDERNEYALNDKRSAKSILSNITFEPRLDYFFNKDEYPPADPDPPTSMTFRIINMGGFYTNFFKKGTHHQFIFFGRSEDYHPIPKISKKTGKPIEFIGNKAILPARFKLVETQLFEGNTEYNFSIADYEINDYEGYDYNVTFDGYQLNFTGYLSVCPSLRFEAKTYYSLVMKVYDLPRMKVQGLFQYKYAIFLISQNKFLPAGESNYTVDTRNVFFQNISMFYNQRVNVTDDGYEPTGEDSGFWVNTPCNTIQMATIMVDYHFFDTIHRMQRYGYEFGDRFQLRIHTPYYRKTLLKEYSLFRSQWNKTYPEPRVFIHPISKYKEYCETYKNCTKFNYTEWSTDPKFTKYIMDVKNEIRGNQIWINFTELERIYEADGFHRGKLVINVNNTMTPHYNMELNGLWAELVDTVTNDWVMKTKTNMDEVEGYLDDYEPDPYRNFYLTCEIPNNLTTDDIQLRFKKYGVLLTANIWIKLDVYCYGVTKFFPQRFNTIIKFPPQVHLTNRTFMYTYQYYINYPYWDTWANEYFMLKDLRQTGVGDGTITNETFDITRNRANISELHPNYPNGDDDMFYNVKYKYVCRLYTDEETGKPCNNITINRQYLFYFYDLELMYDTNNTGDFDITIYQVRYVPYHSKNQINRGLHRWNPHHSGWVVPDAAFYDSRNGNFIGKSYRHYVEPGFDNYYYKPVGATQYYNVNGTQALKRYDGYDCVFSFIGGSTLRNTTCEFWEGIIPNKPFTNYARDIVEETIAYRTLNDGTFTLNTGIREGFRAETILTCTYQGHFTSLWLRVGYYTAPPPDEYRDNELTCRDFYVLTPDCWRLNLYNFTYIRSDGTISYDMPYKAAYTVHKYPQEFFSKLRLPEPLRVASNSVGKVIPCHRDEEYIDYYFLVYIPDDYLCYYVNSTTIYFFNTIRTFGAFNNGEDYDISVQIDDLFILESMKMVPYSGYFEWGFYDNPLMYLLLPQENLDHTTYLNDTNCTMTVTRNNTKNDEMTILNISLFFNETCYNDLEIKLYFGNAISDYIFIDEYIDGKIYDSYNFRYKCYNQPVIEVVCMFWNDTYSSQIRTNKYIKLIRPENTNDIIFYFVLQFNEYYKYYNHNLLESKKNKTMTFDLIFQMRNPRSFKPSDIYYFMFNQDLYCLFQEIHADINNTLPQLLLNMTVSPNSYFTGDRAIYRFNYITYSQQILIGDVFEFKTSWKTKYTDNEEAPDDKGYYINRIYIDKNYNMSKLNNNMTLIKNFILNPDTLETQYIKDIRIVDNEGYLISVCEDIIPIKMKRITGFKRAEVSTEKTNIDNEFDISFEIVPEILLRKNDELHLKFSSTVSLKDYPECLIESEKGLSISDPDFKCEIDKENNELILSNPFKEIGENISIFENLNSTALTDQQFIFSLKSIPIYSSSNELEDIFSIELKTENERKITQTSLLPATAIFKCDSRCKTCNEESPSECLTCSDNYPIFYPEEKYCHKFCPKEKYYQKENENGQLECLTCQEPCQNCMGKADNCTFCPEGYFLDNNLCVKNCSEEKGEDLILRVCYPLPKKNKTIIVNRTIYVNVSIPEPYPVYIHRNICIINGP